MKTEQITVASTDKAIDDLLSAHRAIMDAWFKQWSLQQRARIASAFDAKEESNRLAAQSA